MRTNKHMLHGRSRRLIAGGLLSTTILPGLALASAQADTTSAPVTVAVSHHKLRYGQRLVVTGRGAAAAGRRLALEFAGARGGAWRVVATTTAAGDGAYRLTARVHRTGAVRVLLAADGAPRALAASASSGGVSQAEPIAVAGSLATRARHLVAYAGHPAAVAAALLPRGRGRIVYADQLVGHHWRAVGRGRTRSNGHVRVAFNPVGSGGRVRLRFKGDRDNGAATAGAGDVSVLRPSVASWYSDGGATACGFHAANGMGVANKSLPCGTRVVFSYHGRTAVGIVDDRGPFVGGREWDLSGGLAAALGFNGVDTVWTSR